MEPSIILVLSLLLLLHGLDPSTARGVRASKTKTKVNVDIPKRLPSDATAVLDKALASLSFETSFFNEFSGNLSHPNILFAKVLKQISKRTGKSPDIRPGGITADSTWFDPSATEAIVRDETASGGIYRTTLGPSWYESIQTLPKDINYVIDVNMQNLSLANTTEQIRASLEFIPADQITSFELGNENDHFGDSFAKAITGMDWDMKAYTDLYLNWTSSISAALNFTKPIFSAGTFVDDPPEGQFNVSGIIDEGVLENGQTLGFSMHQYQYSTCDPPRFAIAILPNLISHKNITAYIDKWVPQIQAADKTGRPFEIGEYNSVSCSGKFNVTDTFGQALWTVDTILWNAYRGVKRLYLHQGATLVLQSSNQANTPGFSKYNMIIPLNTTESGPARLTPGFVSYLLVAEALGKSANTRMAALETENEDLALYGFWDRGDSRPARLVALNMQSFNSTDGWWIWNETTTVRPVLNKNRPVVSLNLRGLASRDLRVKRMKATGLNEKNPALVTWAGQQYSNGDPVGHFTEEIVTNGVVDVFASEGVLITVGDSHR